MKPTAIALLASALLAVTVTPGRAQYVVSAKSGTINLTEGQVQLDGQKVDASIARYPAIKEASVLRTEDGRAEVLLTPGVVLRLGDHASLKMITNRLIDTRLELLGGSAVVEADLVGKDTSVTVVVNGTAVSLPKAGIYRFSFDPAQVKVFKGEAAVLAGSATTLVGAGRMCALGATTAAVEKFAADDTDALDHWSRRRGELMSMANTASANSPSGNGFYGGTGFTAGLGMPFMGCSGYGMMPGFGYGGSLWAMGSPYAYSANPMSGVWSYNSWYDMFTYMPCGGGMNSPYGYPYAAPAGVGKSPTVVSGPTRRPIAPPVHRPTLATTMSLADRHPMALAVNGLRGPGFAAGARASYGYRGAASSEYGGFASSGSGNSSASSSSTTAGTAFSGTATHGNAGVGAAVSTRGGGGSGGGSHR
jgi:hypothetical protein